MHPHLQRQLEQLGLAGASTPPTAEQWQLFLEQVSCTYDGARSQQEPVALQDFASRHSPQDSRTDSEFDRPRSQVNNLGAGLCILDQEAKPSQEIPSFDGSETGNKQD